MGYERYPRGTDPRSDYYNRSETQDYGRDYGSGRDQGYSSARDYAAAGQGGDDRYGRREYGNQRYGQRERFGREGYGAQGYGRQDQGRDAWRGQDRQGQDRQGSSEYHGSYGSDGRRFEDVGRYRHADDDNYRRGGQAQGRDYGRQPQGYDYEDRGFFQRAGDEVRSWFGDEDAERRREYDSRYDERAYGGGRHDEDYHSWRSTQIAALDRDYDEYRQENRSRFENEFATWRTGRQSQRQLLESVKEHQDVVGSDGGHVGTVDKVRGDRILLTKNDADAGGQHHSIPSSWIASVDDKVTLTKSADDAKRAWRDEDRRSAMSGYGDNATGRSSDQQHASSDNDRNRTGLNRSFSGTY